MEKVREQIQIQKQKLECGPSGYDPIASKNPMNLFRRCCLYVYPNFCVDDRNHEAMNKIFLYLIGGSNILDHSKGLWLYGFVGTGEPYISEIIQIYDKYSSGKDKIRYYLQGGFPIGTAAFAANQYCKRGIGGILSYDGSNRIALGLDKVGQEPKIKHYGTEMDVVQYILQMRYDNRRSCTTFAATSSFPEEVHLKYGEYIVDRVNEMFSVMEVRGRDRR